MTSIRHRLLDWLVLGLTTATILGSWGVYLRARDQAREIFDFQMRQMAYVIPAQGFSEQVEPEYRFDLEDVIVKIWSPDGVELYSSHFGTDVPRATEQGFSRLEDEGGRWRIYSTQVQGNVVQVAQLRSVREELATAMALRAMLPLLLLFPLLLLLVWVTVGRGLKPLGDIAEAVRARSAETLEPLPEYNVPEEVKPLVEALNELLARLEQAMRLQRSFIADAAHELRTPLTAVALQLQLAERAQPGEARTAAFAKLRGGSERATHLVQQLLALARAEPEGSNQPMQPVDLSEVARCIVVEQNSMAVDRGLDLGVSATQGAVILGHPEALRVLVGNLVDNAIRYTHSGRINVETHVEGAEVLLVVSDTGCGIPPEDRERVFDRFYRRASGDTTGSGLGLAIVQKIAQRYEGRVSLEDGVGGRGLKVTVRFPAAGDAHGPVLPA